MYPFEGKKAGETARGTVEGETIISALEQLVQYFDGQLTFIAERPPKHDEDKRLFAVQTMALLSTIAPKPPKIAEPEPKPRDGVATVLDRQFVQLLDQIVGQTKELLKERQFAEDIREMHSTIFTLEKQQDITLKEKYDALSYILRELSYVEDGLDPSPLKKDLRNQIDAVVATLKKVEKSMVRTAFHMDNLRIHQEGGDDSEEMVQVVSKQEASLSRYASRRRLVQEILQGIRALSTTSSMTLAGAEAGAVQGSGQRSGGMHSMEAEDIHSTHAHESEPLGHLMQREFPMILEWFVGFSLSVIIAGQIVDTMSVTPTIAGISLADFLRPFAWQPIFIKTTLLALILLTALRLNVTFADRGILRWMANMILLVLAAIFSLGL